MSTEPAFRQDLHIHTTWSHGDGAVAPEQTVDLVAAVRHAQVVGISDHFHYIDDCFDDYAAAVRAAGLRLGTEVDLPQAAEAAACEADYYIAHCFDDPADYRALETLLATGRPVIIAHPHMLGTDLSRVPPECLVEINNRYIWRTDWRAYYQPYAGRFRFVLSSDAHQPNWLSQSVARHVAAELGIEETLLFTP